MSVATLPQWLTTQGRGYRTWAIVGGIAVLLGIVLYASIGGAGPGGPVAVEAQRYQVVPIDMDIKITKDGEVHSIDNIDINCQVEGSSTITTIVKEGTSVKKGEVLLTLDSTNIRQRMEDTSLELQKAEADVSNAREMFEIQKNTNDANLESANVSLTLAKLDLKQYEEGTYPQQVANAKTEVRMAQITLDNRREDLLQTKKLYTRNFVTAGDVNKAELDVTTAQNALDKAETALKVLTEYSHEMDLTSRKNTVVQAEQRLYRTQRENTSNLSWRTADLTAKEQNLMVLKRRAERLKTQYEACTVKAPADGMVIYGSTTDRQSQTQIQEGANVRERQLLVRLPDTTKMKAVVRIHEALVSMLSEGQKASVKIVGVDGPVEAKISKIAVVADSSNRWWNPDLREYPIDLALDATPPNLKPGIGAVIEIFVERLEGVLGVPLDCVYTVGADRYAFVAKGEDIRPVKVTVGQNNDTHVQILDGVEAGAQVLRLQSGQGRALLEKAGVKIGPATRPGNGSKPAVTASLAK